MQRVALARDHVEVVVSPRLAGVSDRGKRHHRNEDALALASVAGGDALVVCDGVSSSQNPDDAATAAAQAACAALVDGLGAGVADLKALIQGAIRSARDAVEAVPFVRTDAADPPETTIVLAIRSGRRLAVGWIGDSRAYYLGTEGTLPLTRDHSWAVEVVATGEMTAAEAFRAPQSHAVTRTLGGPTGGEVDEPSFATFEAPDGPGLLLLCSDGLWNYAPEPEQMAELLRAQPPGADALAVARGLVDFARDRGGHDNITVAVLEL
ncbi:MAG TPA: protein phosphatase 2C domain-containing protein [Opitutaceae bacterium]|nr:protein phosphatase 2C domain-containing protein [Opitutaceae bacterium]